MLAKNHRKQGMKLPLILALLLALLSGAMFSFALAPYHLWVLAIVSPAFLYALLLNQSSAKRAFWLGEFYGFGTWAVGAFWLFTSIHDYGHVPNYVAFLLIGVMAAVMGLFHAVSCYLFVKFLGRQPLAFAALWVVQEWLKTWLFTGFPWLFVGYAMTEVAWLNGLAPVTGVLGLSFLAVLFGAALIELFRYRGSFMVIAFVLVVATVVLSVFRPSWTTPTGKSLQVSLVQGNIPQDLKWQAAYQLETLAIYAQLSQGEWGRDLVVWPEAAIPVFQDDAMPFIDQISNLSSLAGSSWVTGVPYREERQVGQTQPIYNSVMGFDENVMVYRKQHLVPFGEYIPLEGWLNILPNLAGMQNAQSFSVGQANQESLKIKGANAGVAICYEVAYPQTTRINSLNAEFLLTVSNDAWFGTSAGPMQHLQMVQMRSLELGRWFVRATNNGVTALINEKGQVVSSLPQFQRGVLRGELVLMTGLTPYARWGMTPILILSAFLIVLSVIAKLGGQNRRASEKVHSSYGVLD